MGKNHYLMQEAIENINKSNRTNRGQYPWTKASNVFKEDGTPLETLPDPEPPKPETKTVTGVKVVDGGDGYTEVSIPTVEQVIRANIQTSDGEIGTYPVNPNAKYKWYYKESTDTILGTESSYTVTSDNVGKTICIEVSVTGYEGTATWEATGVVTE